MKNKSIKTYIGMIAVIGILSSIYFIQYNKPHQGALDAQKIKPVESTSNITENKPPDETEKPKIYVNGVLSDKEINLPPGFRTPEPFVMSETSKKLWYEQYKSFYDFFKTLHWNKVNQDVNTNGNLALALEGIDYINKDPKTANGGLLALERFTLMKPVAEQLDKFYGVKLRFKGERVKVTEGDANTPLATSLNKGKKYSVFEVTLTDGVVKLLISGGLDYANVDANSPGAQEFTGFSPEIDGWPIGIGSGGELILVSNRIN